MGMLGVAFGILSTLFAVGFTPETLGQAAVVSAAGAILGLAIGRRCSPMQLPQTVAALHSVVGLAAVMTSAASVLGEGAEHAGNLHLVTAYLGLVIGGVTFTGELFDRIMGQQLTPRFHPCVPKAVWAYVFQATHSPGPTPD